MSAIHTGSITARLTADGLWQYAGTSHDHAVTGWDVPKRDASVRIPAQRDAFEMTAGCAACGCECTTGPACSCTCCCSYEPAVAVSVFVRELLRGDRHEMER